MNLMLGDCLERMKEIPDGSIDMILCDLPYSTTSVACVNPNRNFTGIEMNDNYFHIASERINKAIAAKVLA